MKIERTFTVDKTMRFNRRNARLKPFVERINNARKADGYRPMSPAYLAGFMSYIKTEDLEGFYKELDQSPNFSAIWWWRVKQKK